MMSKHAYRTIARTTAVAVSISVAAVLGVAGTAGADVKPGAYTSITESSGVVLLQRTGYVRNGELVLIGRYRIHPTRTGGYADVFPGHRVFMNRDGHGGYTGPAYFNGVRIGTFILKPQR